MTSFSALVKLLNKSIEGTADDDEEGVTPDTAIRSGLELLKVRSKGGFWRWGMDGCQRKDGSQEREEEGELTVEE